VARACSGINNLIAMLAIGIVIAELTMVRRSLRLAFVAFAVLVALLANPVRVALIGALLYLGYDSYLPGDGHEVQGLIVSVGAFLLLVASASTLSRLFDRPRAAADQSTSAMASPAAGGGVAQPRLWGLAVGCAAVLMMGAMHQALIARAVAGSGLPMTQPATRVGAWFADSTSLAASDLRTLPGSLDPTIYRRRAASDFAAVVTTPLFDAGPRGDTMAWLVGVGEPVTVTPPGSSPVQVNQSVLRSSGRTFGVLYWYQVDGLIFHNRIEARLRGAFSRLLRRPEPATIVAVVAPPARDAELSAAHMDFAGEVMAAGQ
jgi:exosortase/archaeosortase family protein